MSRRYVLITPCRNEAEYLPRTIATIAAQTERPARWVIVDDGSTDATPDILRTAAAEHEFIEIVRREDRGQRSVGPGVIDAFYAGLDTIDLDAFDYVCKFDADLELSPEYFSTVMNQFEVDPYLGNFSGKAYLEHDGVLTNERFGDENAIGAAKFYRVACFREIGGFVRGVCWDGIDGHMCRRHGWIARSVDEPALRIIHLRQMGSSQTSLWEGRQRWGRGKYFMGSSLLYVAAVGMYRMVERPVIVGGLGIIVGYLKALWSRAPRFDDAAGRRCIREYELEALVLGKRRTTARHEWRIRRRLAPPTQRKHIEDHIEPPSALHEPGSADAVLGAR